MFLLVNNRPIQSADSIGFWPIVSVSADSQNSTIGRPLVVGSWAFLLPSFSTTLRPLIISPNLQFNTFRPFSLPLQPDPNLCLSICTGRKKPASFIERDPPLQFACPPEKFVWRSPFAESFLASPNENVKDSAMLKAER